MLDASSEEENEGKEATVFFAVVIVMIGTNYGLEKLHFSDHRVRLRLTDRQRDARRETNGMTENKIDKRNNFSLEAVQFSDYCSLRVRLVSLVMLPFVVSSVVWQSNRLID